MSMFVQIKRLHPDAIIPSKSHPDDAAFDLHLPSRAEAIYPGQVKVIPLGIAWQCRPGFYGQLLGRSGLAACGLVVLGGVIDAGYRGEWKVVLSNAGLEPIRFIKGERIAQVVIHALPRISLIEVDALTQSVRDTAGMGSTGR